MARRGRTLVGWFHAKKDHAGVGDNLVCAGIYRTLEAFAAEVESQAKFGTSTRPILPGQAIFGKQELADRFGISVSRVHEHIQTLVGLEKIKVEVARNKGCLATIPDWELRKRKILDGWYRFHRKWLDDDLLGHNSKMLGLWDFILARARYSEPETIRWNGLPLVLPVGSACIDLLQIPHSYRRDLEEYQGFMDALEVRGRLKVEKEDRSYRYLVAVKTWFDEQGQTQNTDGTDIEHEGNTDEISDKSRPNTDGGLIRKKDGKKEKKKETRVAIHPLRKAAREEAIKYLLEWERWNWERCDLALKDLLPPNETAIQNITECLDRLFDEQGGYDRGFQIVCVTVKTAGDEYWSSLADYQSSSDAEPNSFHLPSLNNIFTSYYVNRVGRIAATFDLDVKYGKYDDLLRQLPDLSTKVAQVSQRQEQRQTQSQSPAPLTEIKSSAVPRRSVEPARDTVTITQPSDTRESVAPSPLPPAPDGNSDAELNVSALKVQAEDALKQTYYGGIYVTDLKTELDRLERAKDRRTLEKLLETRWIDALKRQTIAATISQIKKEG